MGAWRLLPACASRMPAAASYRGLPEDTAYRAFNFDRSCLLRPDGSYRPA